jgi:hypothetical protein
MIHIFLSEINISIYFHIEWFEVAILNEYFTTFGAATTPKHWHVCFFPKGSGIKRVRIIRQRRVKKGTDPFLPQSILPFLD